MDSEQDRDLQKRLLDTPAEKANTSNTPASVGNVPPISGAQNATKPNQAAPNEKSKSDVEQIIKWVTILGIVLYVIGLLTVNTYLYRLGLSDFALLRTKFIYIGAWIALFIALASVPPVLFLLALRILSPKNPITDRILKYFYTWIVRLIALKIPYRFYKRIYNDFSEVDYYYNAKFVRT
jgi:hypothetical protein